MRVALFLFGIGQKVQTLLGDTSEISARMERRGAQGEREVLYRLDGLKGWWPEDTIIKA